MIEQGAAAAGFNEINNRLLLEESALSKLPLFSPTRLPPPKIIPPPPPPPRPKPVIKKVVKKVVEEKKPTLEDWILVGIARSDNGDLVVIQNIKDSEVYRMKAGEMRNGWVLTEVGKRSATFKNSENQATVIFESDKTN